MKKLSILALLSIFILFMGCSEEPENELTPDLKKQEVKLPSNVSEQLVSIITAAKNQISVNATSIYTLGVLDEGKTENECFVVYITSKEYQKFKFMKDKGRWMKSELVLSEKIKTEDTKSYTAPIGYVRGETGMLLGVFYCYYYTSGNYSVFGYYPEPDLAWWLDFYPGVQVNNNRRWQVSNGNNGFWYGGISWVTLWYRLDVTYLGSAPSAPALQSPANGATTGTSVTFSWNAVTGQDVDAYQIDVSNGSSATLSGTSKSFSGFSYSTSYTWKVRAHNPAGWGAWSSTRSFTVQNAPALSVNIVSIGNNQYRANASGGSGGYTYKWWYRNDGGIEPFKEDGVKAPPYGRWFYNSYWDNQTTVSYNPSYSPASLKCEVTDSNGSKDTDVYSGI